MLQFKILHQINKFEITLNTTFIDLIVLEVKRGTKVSRREILLFYFYTSSMYAKYLFKTNIKKKRYINITGASICN